jgi:hypothetical protein
MNDTEKSTAAAERIQCAITAVTTAVDALLRARAEIKRLDDDREAQLASTLDAAFEMCADEERKAEADRIADDAERLSDAQEGIGFALFEIEAMVESLRTGIIAPMRRSERRLRPPAPGVLECLSAVGVRR